MTRPSPAPAGVQLWRAPLDVDEDTRRALAAPLSADEQLRAERLHREVDRHRFMCAHGWLRFLLGSHLGIEPADVALVIAANGKPRVGARGAEWLRFNLSHSGSLAVFALARNREVGVDVEQIRDGVDIAAIARRFLTAGQHSELAGLAARARTAAFFAMWTRNEAYLKGVGTGLLGAARDLAVADGWTVAGFEAAPGYAAAAAVAGGGVEIPAAAHELSLPG